MVGGLPDTRPEGIGFDFFCPSKKSVMTSCARVGAMILHELDVRLARKGVAELDFFANSSLAAPGREVERAGLPFDRQGRGHWGHQADPCGAGWSRRSLHSSLTLRAVLSLGTLEPRLPSSTLWASRTRHTRVPILTRRTSGTRRTSDTGGTVLSRRSGRTIHLLDLISLLHQFLNLLILGSLSAFELLSELPGLLYERGKVVAYLVLRPFVMVRG
mmetsp:Transcript_12903/g.29655  ORF Transcript_12903/g.29655 Transcript_12903/m.29655 type:complete len:216 (+) Transcript_12903:763-1410(+)